MDLRPLIDGLWISELSWGLCPAGWYGRVGEAVDLSECMEMFYAL